MKEKALRYRGHNGARTNKTIKVGFKKEIKGLFLISLRNNVLRNQRRERF